MTRVRKKSNIFENKINNSSDMKDSNGKIDEKTKENLINFLKTDEPLEPIFLKDASRVNHPEHYNWLKEKCGIEVIDICENFDFVIGNALKYILRAGHKQEEGLTDKQKQIEDLKKAVWYLNYKINKLERK